MALRWIILPGLLLAFAGCAAPKLSVPFMGHRPATAAAAGDKDHVPANCKLYNTCDVLPDKHQFYDQRTARYYYFDRRTGRYYWENGDPRFPD